MVGIQPQSHVLMSCRTYSVTQARWSRRLNLFDFFSLKFKQKYMLPLKYDWNSNVYARLTVSTWRLLMLCSLSWWIWATKKRSLIRLRSCLRCSSWAGLTFLELCWSAVGFVYYFVRLLTSTGGDMPTLCNLLSGCLLLSLAANIDAKEM